MKEIVEKISKVHFREVCVGHLKHSCKDLQHLATGQMCLDPFSGLFETLLPKNHFKMSYLEIIHLGWRRACILMTTSSVTKSVGFLGTQ